MTCLNSRASGYTLLELLTIIAIVSILAVVSIPLYFDYSTRAKVSEGVNMLGSLKTKIAETYYGRGTYPSSNTEAGMAQAVDYSTDKISQIYVSEGGVLTVEFSITELGSNNLVSFEPNDTGSGLEWVCRGPANGGVENRYLPPECRT
jgi:Tfp pilus assembly protein, major pilin PilA